MAATLTNLPERRGLSEAAQVIADEAKRIAAPYPRSARSVRFSVVDERAYVRIGGADAPAAGMFETGARHPLFGNRHHWYAQPYRPFLEEAAERKADEAAKAFFDKTADGWLAEAGFH